MMRVVVITVAGVSSRFNAGMAEKEKCLKAIYSDGDVRDTLLMHLVQKCSYADRIIIVGGYQYNELQKYIKEYMPICLKEKILLVYNRNYNDFASGYSLYLGLEEAFKISQLEDILFCEGDLDVERDSFENVVSSENSVITYHCGAVRADRDVVVYKGGDGRYHYIFNSAHGLLKITDAFTCLYNSGQVWKFTEISELKMANEAFRAKRNTGINLQIIQKYIDSIPQNRIEAIELRRWTNCNTRDDYAHIKAMWKAEN